MICEDEPSRLSSISKSLRGDVETIGALEMAVDLLEGKHVDVESAAGARQERDVDLASGGEPVLDVEGGDAQLHDHRLSP